MSTVEPVTVPAAGGLLERPPPLAAPTERELDEPRVARWVWWLALGGVLAASLLLRLWGIRQGLPFAYNADENSHFVPKAIGMFGHDLNPHYFANPPAFTYLLHFVFAIWFGGRAGVSDTFRSNPTAVFMVARVVTAVLGTLAVWLLYLTGARLFDRRVGLLAAGLMAVAFLPVFYSHLALNDVPTLAPLTLALLGTVGVLRHGRPLDYAIAGIGLGLGSATKYTAGIVLVPLLVATATQYLAPGGDRSAVIGLLIAGTLAVAAFVLANPYSVGDFGAFRDGLDHQSTVSEDGAGKLGLTQTSGIAYYLWTLTWGLGWVPALAAIGGVAALWRDERRLVWMLLPGPLLFLAFMGLQGRYFGRWLLPVFPMLCLLAAYAAVEAARWGARARPQLRPTLMAIAVVALLGQGVVYSIHSGLVLSRGDTRNSTRNWMIANIPVGSHIVVEPVVPGTWAQDIGHPSAQTPNGDRWIKYAGLRSFLNRDGTIDSNGGHTVSLEDYERTLSPALIDQYKQQGYCWIVTGSTQSGRAQAAPLQVPQAIAYYRALAQRAQLVYHASPYASGKGPVAFSFDWTFDYYPLTYERPGPEMSVYHLIDGNCATPPRIAPGAGLGARAALAAP